MFRTIETNLQEWKLSKSRKPLLVRGARQVGKSFSVMQFGKNHFQGKTHVFNFEKYPELRSIFAANMDSIRIISEMELFVGSRISPNEDLIFFDEIQECPEAILSLRYFYEEKPEYYIIAAGSLLEFALHDISFPVGRLQMISMYPMSFAEFLIATGHELYAEKLSEEFELSAMHLQKLNDLLYTYFIVGGMPECVKTYLDTQSFVEVVSVQDDLLSTFRQDFAKYSGFSDKRCLNEVLISVARKVGEQIKYSHLSTNFTNPTIKKAFELLETARLFTKVRQTTANGLPLGSEASDSKFKAVFLDIGLLSNISGFYSNRAISKQNFTASFNGKMAEQFVGQELRIAGKGELYYWARDARGSSAEVDYVFSLYDEIIPIEVKSGTAGKMKSLHLLLESHTHIKKAFVLTENKYGSIPEQKLHFKPLVYAGSLDKF